MDEGIRPGLAPRAASTSNPRAFGLVLAAVLSLASLLAARKGLGAWPGLGLLAGTALLAALLRPRWLESLESRWMVLARALAWINTRVILAAIYYLVLTPYGLILRVFSADPLDQKREKTGSYWKPLRTGEDLAAYERIF